MNICANATPKAVCLAIVGGKVPSCHVRGHVHEFTRYNRCKHCRRSRTRCMTDDLTEQIRMARS